MVRPCSGGGSAVMLFFGKGSIFPALSPSGKAALEGAHFGVPVESDARRVAKGKLLGEIQRTPAGFRNGRRGSPPSRKNIYQLSNGQG